MKRDIAVLYNNERDGRTYKGFNSSVHTKSFTGISTLLQKITKLLLTPSGSDMYNTGSGTAIPYFLSRSGSDVDISSLEGEVIKSAGQIEDMIKYDQATDPTLSDDERLKSIDLESIEVVDNGATVLITLLITTVKNDTYIVRI